MRIGLICVALTIAAGVVAPPVAAQSLADVARKEEARRATTKKATKTFTNSDLGTPATEPPPQAAKPAGAAAACDPAAKDAKCPPAEKTDAAAANSEEPELDPKELSVRQRASQLRARLAKAQKEFDNLSAAASDMARSEIERNTAARVASKMEPALANLESEWRALEEEVTDQGLPRKWLEPIPQLSGRIPQ
jgi:hypothetical protein